MTALRRSVHAIRLPAIFAAASLFAATARGQSATPATAPSSDTPAVWKDVSRPASERAADLVSRMTLEEKVSQILANPPRIDRLGIPAYSHRNEALHGAPGEATVFPQATGMAATWDVPLIQQEAHAIAIEGRAKHNDYIAKHNGDSAERVGLNFYSPNINIFRDPRWGRGQETYGEDPFLTGSIGVAFVRGLQGDDLDHPIAIACAKHFAVHSGPEKDRHHSDMHPSNRDLYETYLPAFEMLVRDAHVGSVMGAYSSLNGTPCCADPFLLTEILRKRWGFDGLVFSDGGAIGDIWAEHKWVKTPEEAAAAAVKAGCDVSSGAMREVPQSQRGVMGHFNAGLKGGMGFSVLPEALKQGLITEADIDTAARRELTLRFKLGIFDNGNGPYDKIGVDQVDSVEHRALALKVAQESIVLLKNDGNLLPLDRTKLKRIAVIGPNADAAKMLNGNYAGRTTNSTTILAGIKESAGAGVEVTSVAGGPLTLRADHANAPKPAEIAKAVDAAKSADVVIFVGGIDSTLEKEEADPKEPAWEGFERGDRTTIELPGVQKDLLTALRATGKPIVLVNCSGSAMALRDEVEQLPAIVQAWYPGEEGGRAVAGVLFGDVNPSGKLPVTFYAATSDLPAFSDYSMANRTYRYFTGKPLWAFGHGLSFTSFSYADARVDQSTITADGTIHIAFTVANTGGRDGDEVAQVYARPVHPSEGAARQTLVGFTRFSVPKGQSSKVSLDIAANRLRVWDESKKDYSVLPGDYELQIGGSSDAVAARATVTIK